MHDAFVDTKVTMDNPRVQLDPDTGLYCTLHLFMDVANTAEIRGKIVAGKFGCCAIKASLVVDALQVQVAANKAALGATRNRLITKTVYAETLFCLSMSKNISRALAEFGIGDADENLLLVFLHKLDDERDMLEVLESVKGQRVSTTRIRDLTDVSLVRKLYKIDEEELRVSSLVDAVVSRISCKELSC